MWARGLSRILTQKRNIMKLYTKQKPFSRRFLAKRLLAHSSRNAALTPDFLNRVSIFETLRVYGGKIFRAQEHLARLSESCAALGRALPVHKKELLRWLKNSIRKAKLHMRRSVFPCIGGQKRKGSCCFLSGNFDRIRKHGTRRACRSARPWAGDQLCKRKILKSKPLNMFAECSRF